MRHNRGYCLPPERFQKYASTILDSAEQIQMTAAPDWIPSVVCTSHTRHVDQREYNSWRHIRQPRRQKVSTTTPTLAETYNFKRVTSSLNNYMHYPARNAIIVTFV